MGSSFGPPHAAQALKPRRTGEPNGLKPMVPRRRFGDNGTVGQRVNVMGSESDSQNVRLRRSVLLPCPEPGLFGHIAEQLYLSSSHMPEMCNWFRSATLVMMLQSPKSVEERRYCRVITVFSPFGI